MTYSFGQALEQAIANKGRVFVNLTLPGEFAVSVGGTLQIFNAGIPDSEYILRAIKAGTGFVPSTELASAKANQAKADTDKQTRNKFDSWGKDILGPAKVSNR